jgi:hypothetical protein
MICICLLFLCPLPFFLKHHPLKMLQRWFVLVDQLSRGSMSYLDPCSDNGFPASSKSFSSKYPFIFQLFKIYLKELITAMLYRYAAMCYLLCIRYIQYTFRTTSHHCVNDTRQIRSCLIYVTRISCFLTGRKYSVQYVNYI